MTEKCHHNHEHPHLERTPKIPVTPQPITVSQLPKDELQNIFQDVLTRIDEGITQQIHTLAILTPQREVVYRKCPPKGSLPKQLEDMATSMLPPETPCKVAVICNTSALSHCHPSEAVPFFSLLLGLAYIGHKVVLIEGHKDAILVFCKDVDVCIVDEAMIPFLEDSWRDSLKKLVKNEEVYIFDRKTSNLYDAYST